MRLLFFIAIKHLMDRKRQSIVSLLGIILGVAFFLAVSSLMEGSEKDFIRRLVDNAPHVSLTDEYRNPRKQAVDIAYPKAAVKIHSVKPVTEIRGIRGYKQKLKYLKTLDGVKASPMLSGQALINYAGKDFGISLNGMLPEEMNDVSTIYRYMIQGSVENLIYNNRGLIIGKKLSKTFDIKMGDNVSVSSTSGQNSTFKIVGIYSTGRSYYDYRMGFITLKRMQALLARPDRVNEIIMKIDNPYDAKAFAQKIENKLAYKAESWQEKSEDVLSTLAIRNIIMYSVVSAILIVASFGIYNIISTVVMEKRRDISILKSMGFKAKDIQRIFLIQGIILGVFGYILGSPVGIFLMYILEQVKFKPPGSSTMINMPLDWSLHHFVIAGIFAIASSVMASYLPARKASHVQPVDVLRGS